MGSDSDMRPQGGAADVSGPELVFALVRPTGTPNDALLEALDGILLSYGYKSWRIDLSEILADTLHQQRRLEINESTEKRLVGLMRLIQQAALVHSRTPRYKDGPLFSRMELPHNN
ncbi:hypothetical protein ACIA8K_29705, partial [Catenuloplanes sp. NPDC051500]|uniref:hypothetical protein n=1 Tax=Catenuloplanes sp. NPDC051500 TaxID=3363959 RepID=UPI0037B99AB3